MTLSRMAPINMIRVNVNHTIMKSPNAELSAPSSSAYAARIPEDGQKMSPSDIQNVP